MIESPTPSENSYIGEIRNCRDFLTYFHRATNHAITYGASFFGRGICHSLGVSLDLEITHNLPLSYRKWIRTTAGGVQSPPLSDWFSSGTPSILRISKKPKSSWEENFAAHGYENMAIHGYLEEESGQIAIFGLYNYTSRSDEDVRELLSLLAPIVHTAIHKIPKTIEREFHVSGKRDTVTLTQREEQIVYWVSKGKTNNDISLILGISPNTVRNHLHNASTKLLAKNRSEFVSLAIQSQVC